MSLRRCAILVVAAAAVSCFDSRSAALPVSGSFGLKTDAPKNDGYVLLQVTTVPPSGPITGAFGTPVPGGITDAQKAAIVATGVNNGHVAQATSQGNTVIFNSPVAGVTVLEDLTGTSNTLSVTTAPGATVQAVFYPLPGAVPFTPPPGVTFGVTFFDGLNAYNANLISDGTATVQQLQQMLFNQFAAQGLPFVPGPYSFLDSGKSVYQTTFNVGNPNPLSVLPDSSTSQSATVSVTWDANTSIDLGNFGLDLPSASVPEPTSAWLPAALAGTTLIRRRAGK